MHMAGLYDLNQVKWAILETDGEIAIIPEDNTEPVRAGDDENVSNPL